jgi:flagellar biosynthesis/type III secretory pathway protein FliH
MAHHNSMLLHSGEGGFFSPARLTLAKTLVLLTLSTATSTQATFFAPTTPSSQTMAMSDRLQNLLDTARAGNAEPNRTSMQIAQPYQHITNTSGATCAVARAVQTDAATISLWDLLPRARKEAHERGFTAGKDVGYTEGIEDGVAIGEAGRLAAAPKQAQNDELEHGIEIGKKMGYDEGLAEGMRRATEEAQKKHDITFMESRQEAEVLREKIIVKLPPTNLTAVKKEESKKENIRPKGTGVDPFASLLGLARRK